MILENNFVMTFPYMKQKTNLENQPDLKNGYGKNNKIPSKA